MVRTGVIVLRSVSITALSSNRCGSRAARTLARKPGVLLDSPCKHATGPCWVRTPSGAAGSLRARAVSAGMRDGEAASGRARTRQPPLRWVMIRGRRPSLEESRTAAGRVGGGGGAGGRLWVDRARWGASGALYPQSALAGLNSCPRVRVRRERRARSVDGQVPRNVTL